VLPALARFVLVAGAIAATPGRTTTVVAIEDVGSPLERAFESPTYARAAAADAELRWDDARLLYHQAADAWSTIARTRPSRPLESAVAKAEHEASASQALLARGRSGGPPFGLGHLPEEARRAFVRRQALEDAHLLRGKLMATRAVLGRLPPALYDRTRARLEEARDAAAHTPDSGDADIALLLCATYAVGGDAAAAHAARAQVTTAERADPANKLSLAACAAALGENDAALAALEGFVLRPALPRPDNVLREVYLWNDWDHLRNAPRFESLFR
jgi:hypothetical protein